MTSTRLPGKVLAELAGRPMLAQQLRRLKQCLAVDEIAIATSTNGTDDAVANLAQREDVALFRGSEQDVLSRFVGAARHTRADLVVRLTADCPLMDPAITDKVISELIEHSNDCDYVSNVIERTYPRGLDVEAFFYDTLLRVNRLAHSQSAREHVTQVIRSTQPDLFLSCSITDSQNISDLRWTVDTELDLQLVRILYKKLDLSTRVLPCPEMLAYARANPQIASLNAGVETWSPA